MHVSGEAKSQEKDKLVRKKPVLFIESLSLRTLSTSHQQLGELCLEINGNRGAPRAREAL